MSPGATPDSNSGRSKEADIERQAHDTSYLDNSIVKSLEWRDVSVAVTGRETRRPKRILSDVSGHVAAGETPQN